MNRLESSFDRWLTTEPYDYYTDYYEAVVEALTQDFYMKNARWVIDDTEQIDLWIDKLYNRDKSPEESAKIIERAFGIIFDN